MKIDVAELLKNVRRQKAEQRIVVGYCVVKIKNLCKLVT